MASVAKKNEPGAAEAWRGFSDGRWQEEIDVRDFIQRNYSLYDGGAEFLTGPTQRTDTVWKTVLELLKQVNEELGTSTVVITHAAEIRKMAHRVIWFQDGKIAKVDINEHRLEPAEIAW